MRVTSEPRLAQDAAQVDDRSSSLSDIDRNGNEETDHSQQSVDDDTEAETERLDHSTPQKSRKHESMVLISDTGAYPNREHALEETAAAQANGMHFAILTTPCSLQSNLRLRR